MCGPQLMESLSSKIFSTFLFLFSMKCLLSGLEFSKCFSEKQTGKTLIRQLLPQKQSDLVLHCMSRLFWLSTIVRKF